MPKCVLDQIAENFASALAVGHTTGVNGGAISLPSNPARLAEAVTVEQSWWPVFKTKQLTNDMTYVYVSPNIERGAQLTRSGKLVQYVVTVAAIRKLSELTLPKITNGMYLAQQLIDFGFDYEATGGLAIWKSDEVYHFPDHEKLKDSGSVLFALWDATFEGTRQRAGT